MIGITGRDRVIVENVAKAALKALRTSHNHTDPLDDRRGCHFDLEVLDASGNRTGHIVRVSAELLRFTDPRIPA